MQYNDHPMSSQPLYIIIGLAMALLAADVAFAACMRRDRDPPRPAPALAPALAKSSDASPSEWVEFKRTRSQFLVLTMLLGFASEFLLWMLAPFYPKEAYARGVSPEVVGFLFAAHPVALLISAQFAPCLMRAVEPFVLLQRTLFLQAIFIAGFGLAGTITEGIPFVCCAAVNRFFLGLMSGLNEPTSQAVTLRVVPSHAVAFAFGLIIASRFTAMLVGPAIGGVLYGHGAACCQRSLHPC